MLELVEADSARFAGADGGLVSTHALVVTISDATAERFPAAS
jgi:hypothetical protein